MKKNLLPILGIIVVAAAVYGGIYVWKNYKGALPALRGPSGNITDRLPSSDDPNLPEAMNQTDFPLKLPKGFAISVFAKNLPGARVMVIDGQNNMWVSQTGEGKVVMINKEGEVINVHQNLNKPHGLAVDNDNFLYIAEENRISKISLSDNSVNDIRNAFTAELFGLYHGRIKGLLTFHFYAIRTKGFTNHLVIAIG